MVSLQFLYGSLRVLKYCLRFHFTHPTVALRTITCCWEHFTCNYVYFADRYVYFTIRRKIKNLLIRILPIVSFHYAASFVVIACSENTNPQITTKPLSPDNIFNSLHPPSPERCGCNLKWIIFKIISKIDIIPVKLTSGGKPRILTDDKSILVQVMAWCHQATSHFLNQCWLRSMTLYH